MKTDVSGTLEVGDEIVSWVRNKKVCLGCVSGSSREMLSKKIPLLCGCCRVIFEPGDGCVFGALSRFCRISLV